MTREELEKSALELVRKCVRPSVGETEIREAAHKIAKSFSYLCVTVENAPGAISPSPEN